MKTQKKLIPIVTGLFLTLMLAACGAAATEPPPPTATNTPIPPTEAPTEMPEPTSTPTPEPTMDTGYDAALAYAGTWEGQWNNTTFGSEGPIEIIIEVNSDQTITFSMDVGGFVFGLLDPQPVVYTGNFDATSAEITILEDPVWGDATITFSENGEFEFNAALVPDVEIASMVINGVFSEDKADGEYLIKFTGSGSADGTIEMEKVTE
jgi:hypothetical protein